MSPAPNTAFKQLTQISLFTSYFQLCLPSHMAAPRPSVSPAAAGLHYPPVALLFCIYVTTVIRELLNIENTKRIGLGEGSGR